MAAGWLSGTILVAVLVYVKGQNDLFTAIDTKYHPSVIFYAEKDGNFTLKAKALGNLMFNTSVGHSIFYKDVDLLEIIKLVDATPPVWENYGTYGYIGAFRGLQLVSFFIRAKDGENRTLTYKVVAGELPVGISLEPLTGEVKGVAPDIDSTFVFTVRATNPLGSFADAIFKIVIKNSHVCLDTPCKNEGSCEESRGTFKCHCLHPFGGKLCELNCTNNPLGVSQSIKTVHNSQITAYKTQGEGFAFNGRIGGSGWYGADGTSWLQVDLGNNTDIHGVQMQGKNSTHYTTRFYIQYSLDGTHFENYTDPFGGATQMLEGPASPSIKTNRLAQNVLARFIRFIPVTFKAAYGPYMAVELLGCHMY